MAISSRKRVAVETRKNLIEEKVDNYLARTYTYLPTMSWTGERDPIHTVIKSNHSIDHDQRNVKQKVCDECGLVLPLVLLLLTHKPRRFFCTALEQLRRKYSTRSIDTSTTCTPVMNIDGWLGTMSKLELQWHTRGIFVIRSLYIWLERLSMLCYGWPWLTQLLHFNQRRRLRWRCEMVRRSRNGEKRDFSLFWSESLLW